MNELIRYLEAYAMIALIIVIIIYIIKSIFLSNFNKLVNGEGTLMAWFPITDTYLLGKLTVSKKVGLILVGIMLITGS